MAHTFAYEAVLWKACFSENKRLKFDLTILTSILEAFNFSASSFLSPFCTATERCEIASRPSYQMHVLDDA
jgi:hypothetical protein